MATPTTGPVTRKSSFAGNRTYLNDITINGDTVIGGNLQVTGTITTNNVETVSTSNGIVFEGTVADDFELTLLAGALSADRTITLPNLDGTVALTSQLPTVNDATLTLAASTGITLSATPTFTANASANKTITITNSAPNATHTGDVTGSGALTIANNVVTNAKLADMTAGTIKGRITSDGDPQDLTVTQVRTLLNVADGATANAGTVTEVSAGAGMNFTAITGSGSVAMGTPSTLTDSTTNSASGTTHTHAITTYAVSGTANQITVTGAAKVLGAAATLSLPQNIHTAATPQFARIGLGVASSASPVHIKNATPEVKLEAGSTTDSGTMRYNSTTKSIEFIFA